MKKENKDFTHPQILKLKAGEEATITIISPPPPPKVIKHSFKKKGA